MKALPSQATFRFVPAADRALPPPDQTTFHLRRLSVGERAAIEDMENDETLGQQEDGRTYLNRKRHTFVCQLERVRAGLVSWDNLRDENGATIAFEKGPSRMVAGRMQECVRDDLLDRIPNDVIYELERAIFDAARLTEDDRKNSQSPQPSPSTAT